MAGAADAVAAGEMKNSNSKPQSKKNYDNESNRVRPSWPDEGGG